MKGILTAEDASLAVESGAEGVVVSNHGGRQLDGVAAALDALPEVVEAVGDGASVLMDSGIRRGTDVVKALALGAEAVLAGRAPLWGLATGGAEGVQAVLRTVARGDRPRARALRLRLAGSGDAGARGPRLGATAPGRLLARSNRERGRMETIKETTELNVPVSTAYNQWTQFEDFPKFMEAVKSVEQLDDTHQRWTAEVSGETREWRSEIVEQVPDQKVAWRAEDGNGPNGIVTFEPLGQDTTLMTVEMSYEPEGVKEQLGAKVGLDSRQVKEDLKRFKEIVEAMGSETGAWRGEVHAGERQQL